MEFQMEVCPFKPQGLCTVCQTICSGDPSRFIREEKPDDCYPISYAKPHHKSFASFSAAVEQGCYICTRFRDHKLSAVFDRLTIREGQRPCKGVTGAGSELPSVEKTTLLQGEQKEDSGYMDEIPPPMANEEFATRNSFTKYEVFLKPCRTSSTALLHVVYKKQRLLFVFYCGRDYPSPSNLPTGTSLQNDRSIIRLWLEKCATKHPRCNASHDQNWAPTRVLDLGAEPSTTWRLIVPTSDGIAVPKYTTISYRWGSGQFLKLTSQSLGSFRSGLPLSNLPRTFQDCVSITKHLGIRFIWIDALCIIQDDLDDVCRECALMSSIYTNSGCNIIAGFVTNPHTPLFRTRNLDALRVGKSEEQWKSDTPGFDAWSRLDSVAEEGYLEREINRSEISSRGWILQELLLAPRAIYVGLNQFQWMCRSQEACETWPDGNPPGISTNIECSLSKDLGRLHVDKFRRRLWGRIVERYSGLILTVAADKLLALSGVAKLFQQSTRDEYVGGHWKSELPYSLNWRVGPSHRPSLGPWFSKVARRPPVYTGPSWSWSSVDVGVIFSHLRAESTCVLCTILEAYVTTVGGDPTGRAADGQITLQAPCITATILENRKLTIPGVGEECLFTIFDYSSSDQLIPGTRTSLAVTIASVETLSISGGPWELKLCIHALILLPIDGRPDTYSRVGITQASTFFQLNGLKQHLVLDAFGLIVTKGVTQSIEVGAESLIRTLKII